MLNYSPIINQRLKGDESEPYIATQENLTIKNQKIQLSGIPDYLTHVYIDGMNEIYNGLPKENEFIVDYKYGYVTFNLANDNQNINVSYNSTGCSFFPANRVYTQQIDGEIVETLDGVIQSAQTAINGLEQLDIVIEDAIQITNDVRNYKNCGVYNSLTQYYIGNEVLNDGSSYRAKQDTLGNPPPPHPIIENDYWIMVASKGADGEGSGGSGTGDMLKSTYDPTNKQSDVFSMDNMVETSTKKIMTADERDKLNSVDVGANNYIHPVNHPPSIITQDANNRFVSDSEKTTWNNKIDSNLKGAVNGVAELDATGKVPSTQLPSYVDDVLEYSTISKFPIAGETGKIYISQDTNKTYRWSGSNYVVISETLALGETSSTAYAGDKGKIAYDHSQASHARTDATKTEVSLTNGNIKINGVETTVYTHPSGTNPHGTTKSDVGLSNVDNTSDANKPISTAMQTALNDKANNNDVRFDNGKVIIGITQPVNQTCLWIDTN